MPRELCYQKNESMMITAIFKRKPKKIEEAAPNI
jgi:hypothetical protein